MASVDVPVALLGYGTVGSAVNYFLTQNADDIERATGHRLRIVKALVRDVEKERDFNPEPGVLTSDFAEILDDPSIAVVAEVMGGVEPTGGYILDLLRAGKPIATANKQLLAQRGAELFAAAAEAGVQLRFEASVCAAIPVIKVLRESLVVTNVHRVLGIVNGTTNFILSQMESGKAILATVAFGSRVTLDQVQYEGIEHITSAHVAAARQMDMVVRLVGRATLVGGKVDVRVSPALVDRAHPLAAVEGAFNAVMLQGDAIREITLNGPGAGGIETASAVVADMVSIIGTTGTGFLHNDSAYRELEMLPRGELRSPYYIHLRVDDRPGVLAHMAERLAAHNVSVARLVQHEQNGGAALHVVTHEAAAGDMERALVEIRDLPETTNDPEALPVISERGVAELGWA
jgi:homoserine dehydrogenase